MKTKRINVFIIMIAVAFMMVLCGCHILEIRPSTEEEVDEAKEQGIISDDATTDDTVTVTYEVTDEEISEIPITEEYFPDEVFRQYIKDEIDTDDNEILSENEIKKTISISIVGPNKMGADEYPGLTDLSGIEYFTYITGLSIHNEPIDYIDVSNNTNLCSLVIGECNIKTIDISNNKVLIDAINCAGDAAIVESWNRIEAPYYETAVRYLTNKIDDDSDGATIIFGYDYGTEIITGDYSITVPLEDRRKYDDCSFYGGAVGQ